MKKILLATLAIFSAIVASAQARIFEMINPSSSESSIFVYLPDPVIATGKAVVECPGGGYAVHSDSHEGKAFAPWFNERGIAYFVVKYRLPKGNRAITIADVESAMKVVRQDSAAVWNINPNDIGIMGCSAGGHLASTIATHSEPALRPNFQILFYPVITFGRGTHESSREFFLGENQHNKELIDLYSNEKQVEGHLVPPAIILLSSDDSLVPPVENAVAYYTAMRRIGADCSLHIYPSGGHGWGFGPWFAYREQMLGDLDAWLKNLQTPKANAIRVACIGDSITDGHGIDMSDFNAYPAQLQKLLGSDYFVKNFGRSARTLMRSGDNPYTNERAWKEAKDFQPNIVVIKLGTNDSKPYNWAHKADFRRDLEAMIAELQALESKPKIYLGLPAKAFKPSWGISDKVISEEIIPIIKSVAKAKNLEIIDFYSATSDQERLFFEDGIHPNQRGCGLLARTVAEAIKD